MSKSDGIDVLLFDSQIVEMVLMDEILSRIGCKVTLASNEFDCIEKIRDKKYNLLIFDHSTPGLDVDNFVLKIERFDLVTPIAMMVTLPSKFYEKKYGCSGIDFLIFKPFGLAQVFRLVEDAVAFYRRLNKLNQIENRYTRSSSNIS